MKKRTYHFISFFILFLPWQFVIAQGTPEVLYYRFNGTNTTVPNEATSPPIGTVTATLVGGVTQTTGGSCGGRALLGAGSVSSSDYLNTGWATKLSGSWTISFWTKDIYHISYAFYVWGDDATGFRCFANGAAGDSNFMVRGPINDVVIPKAAITPGNVTTIVMDAPAGKIFAYLNGKLVNTVSQTPVTISSTGPFKVGGYSSSPGMPATALLDEFRVYNRALSAAEVAMLTYQVNTSSTVTVNLSCDSVYNSPSGKYTWKTSGDYYDTIPNSTYCDSIINIKLTLKKKSADTITLAVCETYTGPSKKYTWKTTGIFMDTIPNADGCDSIITIKLTVNRQKSSSISVTACDSYKSPSGKHTWTLPGTYLDTIPTTAGCDSVITIALAVKKKSTGSFTTIVCDSYKGPSGKYTWTTTGTYKDTIPNGQGCDSIITITVGVKKSTTGVVTATVCDRYKSPSGKYTWISSGTYRDTLTNNVGCDSVITFNLTFRRSSVATISPTACNSYTSPSGKHSWTVSGNYKDTIANRAGCDSIITINLTVTTPNITVTRFGFVLTAATNTTYQWLDCNNSYAVLAGETNQTFAITANGSYAVKVTKNSCADTSACMAVTNVSVNEIAANAYTVYPNPTGGQLTIGARQPFANATVRVMNITGQTILQKTSIDANAVTLDITGEACGVYFVEIEEKGSVAKIKLVKF